MKIAISVIIGMVAGGLVITFMLWINDWGRATPSDLTQIVWALAIVFTGCAIGMCTHLFLERNS